MKQKSVMGPTVLIVGFKSLKVWTCTEGIYYSKGAAYFCSFFFFFFLETNLISA